MACHEKRIFKSDAAPAALGPYSVATGGGPFIFTSGQLGIDPQTGNLVVGGIEAQTRQVLKNLDGVLRSSGSCLCNVVKTTVFLKDMTDFAAMNKVYGEFFKENPPARTTVQVAGLPKEGLIEIEVISMLCNDADCNCS